MPWSTRSGRSRPRPCSRHRHRAEIFRDSGGGGANGSAQPRPLTSSARAGISRHNLQISGSLAQQHKIDACINFVAGSAPRNNERLYLGGAAAAPPVGTTASAVLVDFTAAAIGSPLVVLLTTRSCTGLAGSAATGTTAPPAFGSTSAIRSVVTRLVSSNSSRESSCRSSHGGTFSDRDNKSPAPPMSKVYLARRPISRSTIIRSSAE